MQTIGRFEVIGALGQGRQGSVLLARDPDLDRRVAIKLLRLTRESGRPRAHLLHEARAVGALRHPGIIPVYEAGDHDGQPYLVFEHVDGRTLSALIRDQGALKPAHAARLMIDVLDALGHAHDAGIVHRDLKPSNVLVDSAGRARVMDFGVALRIGHDSPCGAPLVGTPCYMAPEYIAHGHSGPQNDIFAAGLLLYEMLFGAAAVKGDGVFQVLHRIANEPLVLPAGAIATAGEPLIDILAKATAKDPSLRYADAGAMKQALQHYLQPHSPAARPPSGSSTLDFLLLRMRHKSDFPAMSAAIGSINRIALSERANAASLANAILKDLALTNKILRLANSAYYRSLGGGRVSTVSRAIVILGFETVRNLAISLMLLEHIRDKQHADTLRDEFLRANLRGLLARALCQPDAPARGEQAYICALFHTLGRLLAHYYFREEAEMIDRIAAAEACGEEAAAARVLGVSYEQLGIGVARVWGFPDTLLHSMHRLGPGPAARPATEDDRLRLLAACANELACVLEHSAGASAAGATAALLRRYEQALPLSVRELTRVANTATEHLRELARVLNLGARQPQLAALLAGSEAEPAAATRTPDPALTGALAEEPAPVLAATPGSDAEAVLSAGIQDISQSLVDGTPRAADLLCAIAELIYRALAARRVLVCLREPGAASMRARYGFGADVDTGLAQLRFALGQQDLFNLILARDVDVLVSDAAADKVRRHLPEWYRRHFDAQSFIVLPLRLRQEPVAMIYAEAAAAGGIRVSRETLALLRTLRNQALLALKQCA